MALAAIYKYINISETLEIYSFNIYKLFIYVSFVNFVNILLRMRIESKHISNRNGYFFIF